MKRFISILIITIFPIVNSFAFEYGYTSSGFKYVKHAHSESSYQHAWSKLHNGIEEYENKDHTRVDCLTKTHAVEFDFANKWAESIGQCLHYQKMTGKKGMVVLILENPEKEMVYYNRVKALSKIHGFDAEYVTPKILRIQNGQCSYKDCKCHRKKNYNNNTYCRTQKITLPKKLKKFVSIFHKISTNKYLH